VQVLQGLYDEPTATPRPVPPQPEAWAASPTAKLPSPIHLDDTPTLTAGLAVPTVHSLDPTPREGGPASPRQPLGVDDRELVGWSPVNLDDH